MKNNRLFWGLLALLALATTVVAQKLTPEELVSRHLKNLGGTKNSNVLRLGEGTVQFVDPLAGGSPITGTAHLASQGQKVKFAFQFGVVQYPGEQFVFDGEHVQVAMTGPGVRSPLGAFVLNQEELLRDGLFGGTLGWGWALRNLESRTPTLKFEGIKKLDGQKVFELSYVSSRPSGRGDLSIHLYFAPTTYDHVATIYRLVTHNAGGAIQEGTDELIETVKERFGDFVEVNGERLPKHWEITYQKEPGQLSEMRWNVDWKEFQQK